MRKGAVLCAVSALLLASLACTITPRIPEINISVPTIDVGEPVEQRESIPLTDLSSSEVDVVFGAGRLNVEAGVPDKLAEGLFRYNVERWAPQITLDGDKLTIKQGGDDEKWGIPSGNVRNHWELEFSSGIPLDLNIRAGAGDGELDFTGLQVSELDVDLGAGDYVLRFDDPNSVLMDQMTLDSGAAKIEVLGAGNANPETLRLQGGIGDISLDLTGAWTRSADVTVRAGAGALKLTLPSDVGVQVETRGGLTNVEAFGLRQMGGTYTNDAFGKTDIELSIHVMTGVGNVRLIEEGAVD